MDIYSSFLSVESGTDSNLGRSLWFPEQDIARTAHPDQVEAFNRITGASHPCILRTTPHIEPKQHHTRTARRSRSCRSCARSSTACPISFTSRTRKAAFLWPIQHNGSFSLASPTASLSGAPDFSFFHPKLALAFSTMNRRSFALDCL